LFQAMDVREHAETRTAADQAERVEQGGTTTTGTDSVDREAWRTINRLQNYLKQLTHHFLYTLAILEGLKLATEFVKVRGTLTELASKAFIEHESFPCLTPNCCNKCASLSTYFLSTTCTGC